MSKQFFMYVNNHTGRKSIKDMTSNQLKKVEPSYTVAGILEGNTFRFGIAKCSKEDPFNKRTGRDISRNRALFNGEAVQIPEFILKNGELGRFFVTKAKRLIKAKSKNYDKS